MAKKLNAKRPQAKRTQDAPPVPVKKSAAQLEKIKREAELQIDQFLKKVGYDNPSERTDKEGWRWFEFGSAKGRAGIVEFDGEMYLRTEALAMELPPDKDQSHQLMRELLETNATITGAARLAINGQGVFVCSTVPVVKLTAESAFSHIHPVMEIAASVRSPFAEEEKKEEENLQPTAPEQASEPSPSVE